MERYNDIYSLSNTEILKRIGNKLKRMRLNLHIKQSELQDICGINKKTISDAENGKNITILTLIGMLRGLNKLNMFDQFIEEEEISPILLMKYNDSLPKRIR